MWSVLGSFGAFQGNIWSVAPFIPVGNLQKNTNKLFLRFPSTESSATWYNDYSICILIESKSWQIALFWTLTPVQGRGEGGSCREQQEGKMTNQNRCLVIHVAHNFWVIFLLKHLSLGEIWGWEPFFGQKVPQVLRMVGGGIPVA